MPTFGTKQEWLCRGLATFRFYNLYFRISNFITFPLYFDLTMRTALREKLRSVSFTRGFGSHLSNQSITSTRYPGGLEVWPTYFTINEQKILLRASLQKLDNSETTRNRKRRRNYLKTLSATTPDPLSVQCIFLPEEYYEFREVVKSF